MGFSCRRYQGFCLSRFLKTEGFAMSNDTVEALKMSMSACGERVKSLEYSIGKNASLFPLSLVFIEQLTEDQKESIDALILRYTQCISMIQDQLFKGILIAEQEDFKDKSMRERTILMERLGAIKSSGEFGEAAVLRNKFAHHYPEESEGQIGKLNKLIDESIYVVRVYNEVVEYINDKRLLKNSNTNRP
jgi:hypothetical protein